MEKYSNIYGFLRPLFTVYHNYFWYKQIKKNGFENWPEDTPVILTPNHQNALMDATAFVFTLKRQIVFLARADIFKNKTVAAILNFKRILPIYRMRDGAQSLGKNEAIFKKAGKILAVNHEIGIFPEAQHWGFRKLRSIKKGVPRIAFQTEAEANFTLGTIVLPVGLYYDEYQQFRKKLYINYGTPIRVSDFKDEYLKNENRGYMALRKAITLRMKDVMLHIESDTYYDDIENIRRITSYAQCKRLGIDPNQIKNEFEASKSIANRLDALIINDEQAFLKIKSLADELLYVVKSTNTTIHTIETQTRSLFNIIMTFLAGISLFPLFLIGFASHIGVKLFLDYFVKSKIKDPQFVRSFKFGLAFFLLPMQYGVALGIVAQFIDLPWYCWLVAFLSFPFFGAFAHDYGQVATKYWYSIKYKLRIGFKKEDMSRANKLYNELIATVVQ